MYEWNFFCFLESFWPRLLLHPQLWSIEVDAQLYVLEIDIFLKHEA